MIGPIFKAYDIRATYPTPLNEEAAWKVGLATGMFLIDLAKTASLTAQQTASSVCVSRDMRPSSPTLARALIDGFLDSGLDVIDLGMADTSIQYFAINHLSCIGGVQTTASHNPIQYNGFKISGPNAKPVGADTGLKEIQRLASLLPDREKYTPPSGQARGNLTEQDVWPAYQKHILNFFTAPAKRTVSVFVDASNGMAGKMVPAVFSDLPGLKLIELNFETNGEFAHDPNPLVEKNMLPTQEGVRGHKADLGACFDGDADRCIFTDELGQTIGCDHLTGLLADYFLKKEPGATIVYDLRSSKSVEETIRSLGGKPHRGRVGHVFMKAALRQTNGCFGGELSGHFYFRDNFFADSGAIVFAILVSILGQSDKTMSQLISPYRKYPQSGELNFINQDKAGTISKIKSLYISAGTIDELDGVSIDAWPSRGYNFNVRSSNTEPLLRLNAEAKDKPTLDKLLAELKPLLGTPDDGHH